MDLKTNMLSNIQTPSPPRIHGMYGMNRMAEKGTLSRFACLVTLVIILLATPVFAGVRHFDPAYVPWFPYVSLYYYTAADRYIDFVAGNDANDGLSTSTPWKHIAGMQGAGGNASAYGCQANTTFHLKGGSVWTNAVMGWEFDCPNLSGVVIKGDPTWTSQTVVAVTVTDPGDGCTSLTIGFSGGGGSSAAGTAVIGAGWDVGMLKRVTITNAGSGYTSNPTVSITGTCTGKLPTATAHTEYAVFDASGTTWNQTNGAAAGYGPIRFYGGAGGAITLQNLEFRHMRTDTTVGSGNLVAVDSNGADVSNVYVHDFGPDPATFNAATPSSANSGGITANSGQAWTATIHDSFLDNSENQFTSGKCGFANDGTPQFYNPPCGSSSGVTGFTDAHGNYIHDARGTLYGPAASGITLHDNFVWATTHDCCQQHPDVIYIFGGGKFYNNKVGLVAPASPQVFYIEGCIGNPCTTPVDSWVFNNILAPQNGIPPLGPTYEFYSGSTLTPAPKTHFVNNTLLGSTDNQCVAAGQWGSNTASYLSNIYLYNNHCITTQASSHWYTAMLSGVLSDVGVWNGLTDPNGTTTRAAVDAKNLVQSPATATGQGYTYDNWFAPTSSSNGTVTFAGDNLTSDCATVTELCTSFNGVARPNAAWQAGAYWYSAPAPTFTVTFSGKMSGAGVK